MGVEPVEDAAATASESPSSPLSQAKRASPDDNVPTSKSFEFMVSPRFDRKPARGGQLTF
jgi:hypothetical protein